jgi:hypothetical protein
VTAAKPVVTWATFVSESDASLLRQMALEHRREGCAECLAGGCLTGMTAPTHPHPSAPGGAP